MNISVFTCVRDASERGGGIASAALPLHVGMYERNSNARYLTGIPAAGFVPGQHCVTASGKGFALMAVERPLSVVLHVHGIWSPFEWRACVYARRAGIPLIMSPHGMTEPWALQHKRLKKWLAWRIYQRRWMNMADLLVVNSWKEYRTVRSMGLRPPVAVIENGVDVNGFDPEAVRTDNRKNVLFLSRLSPIKGIFDLLEAWARLPDWHEYELRIYGHAEPGYAEKVAATIDRLALGDSVKLKGEIFGVEKWQVYKNADLFVLPSYSENFGIVVAEALLSGLPVITTRATPWDCLESECLGWLVENDPDQLANALVKAMLLSDAERQRMGSLGVAYAESHFLWPHILDKYAETYAWLAKAAAQRPDWILED